MNDRVTKLIKTAKMYEKGANVPMTRCECECPCGGGRIFYESVSGFDDRYAYIRCDECEKMYSVRTGCGNFWELLLKES